ncbi:MAG: cell cycle protein, partial [Firmicutes bacterium]|nr:cell cycle protein [Bacillota bacterium]
MRLKKGPPDFVLFITTLALIGIGLIMVFSSSSVTANVNYGDAYYYFKKQLMWAFIGLVAMIVVMKLNFNRLRDFALPMLVLALIFLALVVTPLGMEVKGSSRWFVLGPVRFSPSEFTKLAMVLFLAKSMEANINKIGSFTKGVLPYVFMLALGCGLIMLQPDLGTAFVLAGTVFFMMLVSGAQISHLGL